MTCICAARACIGAIEPHESSVGMQLCRSCRRQMLEHLGRIPHLYQSCDEELEFRRQRGEQRVSGWQPTGIRLNEAVVAFRADTLDILTSWCTLVMESRRVAGPRDRTAPHLSAFLIANAIWLAAQDVAGDFIDELSGIVDRADEVLAPETGRKVRLGTCTEVGCGNQVYAMFDGGMRSIACESGHTVPPYRWLTLARARERAA